MRAILHRKASHWTRAFGLTRLAIKFARLHARALTGERHLLTARDFAILHRKGLLHRYYGYTGPPYFFIPFHFGRKIRTPACVLKACGATRPAIKFAQLHARAPTDAACGLYGTATLASVSVCRPFNFFKSWKKRSFKLVVNWGVLPINHFIVH